MVAAQASKVLHCIRTLALHQQDGATDGNLLWATHSPRSGASRLNRRIGSVELDPRVATVVKPHVTSTKRSLRSSSHAVICRPKQAQLRHGPEGLAGKIVNLI
jgi:hypothetical protein